MSLELNQDTKGLLNSKERGLWDNVRSIEHMAQIVNKIWLVSGAESMIKIFELFGGYSPHQD